MGRLGVVITETFGGYKEAYNKNKSSEWSSLVDDVRIYTPSTISMRLILLRFTPEGTLVGVVRKIDDRGDDNNTAWIFVPSNISISGEELVRVIDAVDAELKAPVADYKKIAGYFDVEYPESPVMGRSVSANATKLAIRYYEAASPFVWSLKDLLDSKYIYQPEYSDHKYIFLVNNKEMQNKLQGASVIGDKPSLVESVKVEPLGLVDGFIPYVNDMPFNKQILAFMGDTIEVEWKKLQYKPIRKSFVVGGQKDTALIAQAEYLKLVDPANIVVFDRSTHQKVSDARICIQGKQLQESALYIPEFQYNKADITVEHSEYESVRLQGKDLNTTISIHLEPRKFSYQFRLPLKNGRNVDVAVSWDTILTESPIAGYVLESGSRPKPNDVNRLVYKSKSASVVKSSLLTLLIALLVGLVAGAGIMFAIGKTTSLFEPKSAVSVVNNEKDKPEKTTNDEKQLQAAIEYLDGHDVWNKGGMDNFKYLKGLWIALDTYNFDEVLSEKYECLMDSEKFAELVELINANKKNEHHQNYTNRPGDSDISYDLYKKAVKRSDSKVKPKSDDNKGTSNTGNDKTAKKDASSNKSDSQENFLNE